MDYHTTGYAVIFKNFGQLVIEKADRDLIDDDIMLRDK